MHVFIGILEDGRGIFLFHISSIKAILTNDKCHLFLNNARVFSNNAGVFCNNTGVLMEELWKRKIPLPS